VAAFRDDKPSRISTSRICRAAAAAWLAAMLPAAAGQAQPAQPPRNAFLAELVAESATVIPARP
jgi:hypothetical protein